MQSVFYSQSLCSFEILEDTVCTVLCLVEGADFWESGLACVSCNHPLLIGLLRIVSVLGPLEKVTQTGFNRVFKPPIELYL